MIRHILDLSVMEQAYTGITLSHKHDMYDQCCHNVTRTQYIPLCKASR